LVHESLFKVNVLQACHDSPLAGNQGFIKTYRHVRERFAWKVMKEDVMRHVIKCVNSQENKDENTHPTGLLQPLPIVVGKFPCGHVNILLDSKFLYQDKKHANIGN
jgi:hypothetical protein